STILDSGATSTLIMSKEYFWLFSDSSAITVKTMNHGSLQTLGCGECVAELTLNKNTYQLHLTNCLHAPG
ncbi:hypothetical protein BDR04DRAFT_982028, partial [Suillus decipiens]